MSAERVKRQKFRHEPLSFRGPKILSVWANKGGVGKTTVVSLLGDEMFRRGKRCLLVDLSPQMNLTANVLGSEDAFEAYCDKLSLENQGSQGSQRSPDIASKLEGLELRDVRGNMVELCVDPIVIKQGMGLGSGCLHLLPGSPCFGVFEYIWTQQLMRGEHMLFCHAIRAVLTKYNAKHEYDCIILDCAPDLYTSNRVALWNSDLVLIPSGNDAYCKRGFERARTIFPPSEGYKRVRSTLKVLGMVETRTTPSDTAYPNSDNLNTSFTRLLGEFCEGGCAKVFSPIEYIAGLGQIPLQEMAYKASKGII